MGRAVPEETAAARATRALAPPAPRPRQGPGAWPVGGARAEPPPLHAPRARRAPGGAAGPRGQRGCGRGGRGAQDWAGWGERLRPSGVQSTLLPLPGARTEEVLGASRGWEPGGTATPSDCSDSLCFGGGSVPALPRALFGNRAEELAARACDHAVRAAPKGATPAIQVKAALQRKRVTLTGRALPLSSPAQTVRGMSEPEQFHKPSPTSSLKL
ncbi:uncharacterized protein LOC129624226 [Bubalus kerabau]|uniref:uncharacterized protein LOC129624226 n=1 Tax=Bubalus carabanensis TaxID=3119969 RepID=UPI00244EE58B|nr:uncharacterized protein LOC129624226 [Bubalus carabanensis]